MFEDWVDTAIAVISIAFGVALTACISDAAHAQEYDIARVSWEAPTARENGDELPPEEILWYEIRVHQIPVYEHEWETYDVSADKTAVDIQVIANECFQFTAYTAATGSPACKPEQEYMLSAPSNAVTYCSEGGGLLTQPKPPREFM